MNFLFRLLIIFIIPLSVFSQVAEVTIENLNARMDRIRDYSADALIKSDIPLIKILPVRATIYFKQKNKFRIKSKGIAILPKQGFLDLSELLSGKENYTALFSGFDVIGNYRSEIITILPAGDTTDLILAKLWIDPTGYLVRKSQITTRTNGTITIDYTYNNQNKFGLPDSMIFTVDVKKFKIPKGVATDINKISSEEEKKPTSKTGKIFIQLTNYQINKGLSDEVFQK